MKLTKSFKIALNIIFHSRLRSWLTILGIVIGIAAIVSIVSIGEGAQRTLEQNLNSLNANLITISPGFSRAAGTASGFRIGGGDFGPGGGGFGGGSSGRTQKNLTTYDVNLIRSIPNVVYVAGIISGSIDNASFLGKTSRVSIEGIDPSLFKYFTTTALASGRYLVQGDANVIVVGGRVANSTFSGMEVNRQLSIGGQEFKIAGILEQTGGSDDSRIFMPIDNAINVLESKTKKDYDSIMVEIKDISLTDDTVTQITNALMLSHGILQANRQDFSVTSLRSVQQRVTSTLNSASIFLTAIAVISLIVGAIGIMNTMFTSVLEKTRDIGILKALGAKNIDIMIIFLLNAAIIGVIGGILGIFFGIMGSSFISQLASGSSLARFSLANSYVSFSLIIEVFILSMAVGLTAGVIPAYRASKLSPVEALRYE